MHRGNLHTRSSAISSSSSCSFFSSWTAPPFHLVRSTVLAPSNPFRFHLFLLPPINQGASFLRIRLADNFVYTPLVRPTGQKGTPEQWTEGGPRIRGSFLADLEHSIRSVRVFEDWKASFPSIFQLYIVESCRHEIARVTQNFQTIVEQFCFSRNIRHTNESRHWGKKSLVETSSRTRVESVVQFSGSGTKAADPVIP